MAAVTTSARSVPGERPGGPLTDPPPFAGLLSEHPPDGARAGNGDTPAYAADLNLDQIVEGIADGREEHDLLTTLLYQRVGDADTVGYRREVFRDLEDTALLDQLRRFATAMREVRDHLGQVEKMRHPHQREGWFLDAAATYCRAVRTLATDLSTAPIASRGLRSFRHYLSGYVTSGGFTTLTAETDTCRDQLARITYSVRIRGSHVDVSRYDGGADYSAQVERTFERFQQGAVKDYRITYRDLPGMTQVGAGILDLVARLFREEFSALEAYCVCHADFVDASLRRFDRELQFYLAYIDYIQLIGAAGLSFCYPEVTARSKDIFAHDTYDLALARKLVASRSPVVCNHFHLEEPERIIVVSGPNQGGKTTLARTFGQLHHLASVGCPVPGTAARVFLCDQLFTHFEREEDLADPRGKLEDDLVRIRDTLLSATPDSIVIMNEIFTSTTLDDARFLGTEGMKKVIDLDLVCVYVTFLEELAALGETVVSMVSAVAPEDPAERTYKVVRGPADGLAYALSIATKHGLTYERVRGRIPA